MLKRTSKPASRPARVSSGAAANALRKKYDARFKVTPAYRASLPDVMLEKNTVAGALVPIQHVGVSGFRLPLRFRTRGGGGRGEPGIVTLETAVTGTVSVEAADKGINMSRIVRSFYECRDEVFTPELLRRLLARYRREVGALSARLRLAFSYPIRQRALRSGLEGWQYYAAVFEGRMDERGVFRKFIEFDFVYSSACPCSAELAEHARETRGVYAVGHNQRSKARIRVEVTPGARLALEDLQRLCADALRTETQVMVRREDEQAFAELNGAHLKFVEDAARLLFAGLNRERRIVDFEVACAHLESLHSHDAVSVICKGVPGGFAGDFADFRSLVC